MQKFQPLVLDTDKLRIRMTARLAELNKTTRGAAREVGLRESTIRNLMEGRSKSPRFGTLMLIGKALEVPMSWFFNSAIKEEDEIPENRMKINIDQWIEDNIVREPRQRPSFEESKNKLHYTMNEQIRTIYPTLRKDGSYIIDRSHSGIFMEKPKLPKMIIFHHYLLWVRNDNMWPVFRHGDQLLIDPDLPLRLDEDYVFSTEVGEGGQQEAWLARLCNFDDSHFHISVLNPRAEFKLDRRTWIRAEAVAARLFPTVNDEQTVKTE